MLHWRPADPRASCPPWIRCGDRRSGNPLGMPTRGSRPDDAVIFPAHDEMAEETMRGYGAHTFEVSPPVR
eukprot:12801198-Prorocentrum_lima.AAC.1